MRQTIVIAALSVVLGSCTTGTETQALSLAEELAGLSPQVNQAVDDFFTVLDQPYENRAQLYERLIDLRLPATFAIQLDKARRVEPPPGTGTELDRYLEFLGDLVFASENLDTAIATADPVATAIAAVSIEVASGALAVALPTASCTSLTPQLARDLCDPGELDVYEAEIGFELRRFVASFRPAFRVPDTFGDVVRGRVLATLQADAARVLETTHSRIAAVEPGPAYARVQTILLEYFPRAAEEWARYEADPSGSDPFIYTAIVDGLEAERTATRDRLEIEYELVLAALPQSQIDQVLAIWFGPPAVPAVG